MKFFYLKVLGHEPMCFDESKGFAEAARITARCALVERMRNTSTGPARERDYIVDSLACKYGYTLNVHPCDSNGQADLGQKPYRINFTLNTLWVNPREMAGDK